MKPFEITEHMLLAAKTYIPIAEKQAMAEAIAEKCLEEVSAPRANAQPYRALTLPMLVSENFVMKRLCLAKVFLEYYFGLETPNPFDEAAYDSYFSGDLMYELEKFRKKEQTRDISVRILNDYRELCRMVDCVINREKLNHNDAALRVVDGFSVMFSPENLKNISAALERIKAEQKPSEETEQETREEN